MFSILKFEISFLKNKNCFKKLEYQFLVESTTIQNALFPFKTALLKSKVKTYTMEIQNEPITQNSFFDK